MKTCRFVCLVALIICISIALPVFADEYPARPITMMIPYAPGGNADVLCRMVCDQVSKILGKPINYVFKPGGALVPGTIPVLQAKADGYMIYHWSPGMITLPMLRGVPFSYKDFAPVTTLNNTPGTLMVKKDSPIKDLNHFIKLAKEKKLNIGINAIGSMPFMAAAITAKTLGVKFNYITCKTNNGTAVSVMGNHVDAGFATGMQILKYSDKLRPLTHFGASRMDLFPDVPTAKEQGLDVEVTAKGGFAVKAGTPEPILKKLESAFLKVQQSDDFVKMAVKRNVILASTDTMDAKHTQECWEKQTAMYSDIIKEINLKKK